ncbi:glutamate synthase large subunit [Mammaliicoccus stepanovicii]|uniref:Glutamate synthase large subunit n=1 Tax=Mammaliicoccus stepanovicii TaxID=643214 RepID=A0A240AE62_9STAP|nr:glutamate synthase large subunit [Mammaliicoccus stepanovicii]PNZ77827.1 glutamate synthase large subunit [Mammaliicoccus stepanovicii]GGI43168.1 glutamate synthase [Mammaliicoccus stepanovicii]SNV81186.1 glutamate synthase large subunit [Mammaliicoccus stepanovicii]
MSFKKDRKQLGLYDSRDEHDACGIGFYANMDNKRSHDIVLKSIEMLCRLDHRGGVGADGITGDGAGIMTEVPHRYFKQKLKLKLPEEEQYAVGMFFSNEKIEGTTHEEKFNAYFEEEGLKVLYYRDVPVDTSVLANHVAETMPHIQQVFVASESSEHFDRSLFIARKQIERYSDEQDLDLYFSSLSRRTIVYKGWLRSDQIRGLYLDILDDAYESKFGSVHSRFSTNTFPSWKRAHPNRLLMHNGEINTIQGNVNWMRARQDKLIETIFGDVKDKIGTVLDESGSDSSIVDNALEFLSLSIPPEQAAMLLIPEPWLYNDTQDPKIRAFYEYYSYLMEPWDGPTMISFCDGDKLGALTDRNGLRPGRYTITDTNEIIFSSEVGVIDVDEENVVYKGQLNPGKLLLVDFKQNKVIENDGLKQRIANEYPYDEWISQKDLDVNGIDAKASNIDKQQLFELQRRFGYTKEEIDKYMSELVNEKKDPLGAMGFDTPVAVLSSRPESLFNYFKQHFAQVTNPPIDSYREKIVTSELAYLGKEGNLLLPSENNTKRIQLNHPILSKAQLSAIEESHYQIAKFATTYKGILKDALEELGQKVSEAVNNGAEIIVLEDETVAKDDGLFAMPILLAVSHIHQYLIRTGQRLDTSIVAYSGECREVHHVATLLGYGANAIVPYLAQYTVEDLTTSGRLEGTVEENVDTYNQTLSAGVIKVMAKMGISTVQSYQGAQIFEAVGLSKDVVEAYFTGTPSKLSGISIETIDNENKARQSERIHHLNSGSTFQWRQQGEHHAFNPKTIHLLQHACRENNFDMFKEYSEAADNERMSHLRNLLDFNSDRKVSLKEVESADEIVKRFKTGAMSFGSISEEAHQTLAEAMNRIGGRSNSGEGGENPERFIIKEDGTNYMSAIKQVASGRFGVTSDYLQHAKEIQIKVAQGAKPGEGGQLPGTKVYPWVAEVRGSTPGVGLISPPPHHDIYSIEDLAQLIHDLKNANRKSDISVKLVSKSGVGTIAAGVAKAYADKIVISGYDGGTGASPKTSIQHAGLPWEIGLSETHQTLMLNGLRSRVTLETDGKLMTGRDVALACALGAEEFAFASAPLVVLGCIMMRVCHKDTCPVGIATQNGELRKLFTGKADHIVNFMYFIAEEIREILASLGLKKMDELVGRTDLLKVSKRYYTHPKARELDIEALLFTNEGERHRQINQNHHLDEGFDLTKLYEDAKASIDAGEKFVGSYNIGNTERDVGVITGSYITEVHGEPGLPEDTIHIKTFKHAGQSYGAFIPKGMTLHHTGDANDYFGKGLSGGKLILKAPNKDREQNIIVGNVCFYGATSGTSYINGRAGERFCVRNSGVNVVVEGIGDHGLEYMTGGRVVILGDVGRNFGQGMSGGVCYALPTDVKAFKDTNQLDSLEFETLTDQNEILNLKHMLEEHVKYTNSKKAKSVLASFDTMTEQFVKVIPKDYKLMMQKIAQHKIENEEDALLNAFFDERKTIDGEGELASVY